MQQQTVDGNLEALFSNFQVFKQQRHKISLQEIEQFDAVPESTDEVEMAK